MTKNASARTPALKKAQAKYGSTLRQFKFALSRERGYDFDCSFRKYSQPEKLGNQPYKKGKQNENQGNQNRQYPSFG